MDKQQVKWAKQHDWFVREQVWEGISSVIVVERNYSELLGHWEQELEFKHFNELRDWAGY